VPVPEDSAALSDLMRSLQDSVFGLSEPPLVSYFKYEESTGDYSFDTTVLEFFDYNELYDSLNKDEKQEYDDLLALEERIQERFGELYEELPESEKADIAKIMEIEEQDGEEFLEDINS
jgi:hypothetical protein